MDLSSIVLANGCFDPFHYGHLLYLEEARKMGTALFVGVTRDEYVNKGPDKPMFTLWERLAVLKALRIVDHAGPCISDLDAIQRFKPKVFVKHEEYEGKIDPEITAWCETHGVKIAFTRDKKYSSRAINDRLRHS